MAPPPAYKDISKSLKDLLTKNYHVGFVRFESKSKSGSLELKSTTSHNIETAKFLGGVELKHKIDKYGITVTPKVNTDGELAPEITIQDQLAKGVKLTFDSKFAPNLPMSGTIKSEYETDNAHINLDMTFANAARLPEMSFAGVFGYQDFLAGAHVAYDTARGQLTKQSYAVAYKTPEAVLHGFLNDMSHFGASVYQRVDRSMEVGVEIGYSTIDQRTRYALGARYDDFKTGLTYRGKLTSGSEVSCALTHTTQSGLKLTASALFNLAQWSQRAPRVGLGLEYES